MSRHLVLRFGFGVFATVTLTLAGCASSMKTAANGTPEAVLAGAAQNAGFWSRVTSWMPKASTSTAADKQVQNPGKLHLAYAHWQEKLGNLVEARESYELVIGDNPKSADAILGLARLDQLNNRNFNAEQHYLKALKLKPNDPNVLDAVGQFYAAQQRWGKSIDLLDQAVRLAPRETAHRFNLAVALARAGRVNEALPHFNQTVGDAEAHYNIGYILYQKNDLVGAERHLLQAVVSQPELAQAQQMLSEVRRDQAGRTLFANGRRGGGQNPDATQYASDARRAKPVPESYIQTGHHTGNNDRGVAPTASATRNAPQDYRRQHQQQYTPAENRAATRRAARTQSNAYRSPPPWHSSPAYDRSPATSRQHSRPQQRPPANTSPATTRPTPEQLEQWRNQLSPTNDARGY